MSIRKPIELAFKGESKKLIISMSVIERVNNEIGVLNASRIDPENFDFVKISKLYFILFDEAGFDVDELEVYDNIFAVTDAQRRSLINNYAELCNMLMPNFNAPTAKKKKSTRKK